MADLASLFSNVLRCIFALLYDFNELTNLAYPINITFSITVLRSKSMMPADNTGSYSRRGRVKPDAPSGDSRVH